ncbi:lipoprotein [Citrobacter youngae]|nr:lipoprotein [Citrobacter youngae]
MKKWLVVMMAVWLTSCSSGGESKSYYQLPIAQGGDKVQLIRAIACCGLNRLQYLITWRGMVWCTRPAT